MFAAAADDHHPNGCGGCEDDGCDYGDNDDDDGHGDDDDEEDDDGDHDADDGGAFFAVPATAMPGSYRAHSPVYSQQLET